jgi:hypothetical protein
MQFSGLETTTISIIGSIVTGAVVRVWMGRGFVSKETCTVNRTTCDQVHKSAQGLVDSRISGIEKGLSVLAEKTSKDQAQQYRMLRALVVYSNIPPEKQQEILNDRSER